MSEIITKASHRHGFFLLYLNHWRDRTSMYYCIFSRIGLHLEGAANRNVSYRRSLNRARFFKEVGQEYHVSVKIILVSICGYKWIFCSPIRLCQSLASSWVIWVNHLKSVVILHYNLGDFNDILCYKCVCNIYYLHAQKMSHDGIVLKLLTQQLTFSGFEPHKIMVLEVT